jgi:trans-aconitate 2-methyltransferase
VSTRQDTWDPAQYQRFAKERRQPFDDLLALVQPVADGSVVDLGCGTGELTVELHQHVGAATTLGIDSSSAMLERAPTARGVAFEHADIRTLAPPQSYDVVFANAALQWVPDHERLLPTLASLVADGGQIAVQVPANADHPSHTTSVALANEEPFRSALGDGTAADPVAANVLTPERYAELLHELGFGEQHVRLQVYGHVLDSPAGVVEWTKGTSLTRFKDVLAPDVFDRFVDEYRSRLVAQLGDRRPYFYAFKRILFWGRKP